jgi:hypothetical protein
MFYYTELLTSQLPMVNEAPCLWLSFAEYAFAMSQFAINVWICAALNQYAQALEISDPPVHTLPLSICDKDLYIFRFPHTPTP